MGRSLFSSLILALGLLCLFAPCVRCQVPDESANKCVNPSSKSDVEDGKYYDTCVQGASFSDQEEPFNFNSAYVKNTTFTKVKFRDSKGKKVELAYAFWYGVKFVDCEFEGDSINFDQAVFSEAIFENCVFKSRVSFTRITIRNSQFSNCVFEKGASFSFVDISSTKVIDSKFEGDETLVEHTTSRGLDFARTEFAEIRFQLVEMREMSMERCTVKEFICHEDLDDGEYAEKRAEFEDTEFVNTEFRKVSCDQSIWRTVSFRDVIFGDGTMDYSKSSFSTLTIDGITDGDDCAKVDMSSSNITKKGVIEDVDVCEFNLEGATLEDVDSTGLDLQDKKVKIKNAVFGTERIGDNKCCVELCEDRKCKCDIPPEPKTGCPKGDSATNLNIEKSTCFPADALVRLESGLMKRMDQVQIGDSVLVAPGVFSEVFMFTHRLADIKTNFVTLHMSSGSQLSLTSGHLLYVDGQLLPARKVRTGSALHLADGSMSYVAAVTRAAKSGLYNPQTIHGDIVVNGIITSTYTTAVRPVVAHALLAPLRVLYTSLGWTTTAVESGGESLLARVARLD